MSSARRSRFAWLQALPVATMLLVAAAQHLRVYTSDLSPWVGGGFGMFASTDGRGARHLHIVASGNGMESELFPSREQQEFVRRARSDPSDASLAALAHAMLADHSPTETLRIEVWRTLYDREMLTPSNRLLRQFEIHTAQSDASAR